MTIVSEAVAGVPAESVTVMVAAGANPVAATVVFLRWIAPSPGSGQRGKFRTLAE